MKRLSILLPLLFLLVMVVSSVALAATWEYKFPITVTSESTTNRTYYPVLLGFSADQLVNQGYFNADGMDSNMQVGSTSIKYMLSTDNVASVIPSYSAGSVNVADLYTGYAPVQTSTAIITGNGGYVTISDAALLELANEFRLEHSGYVNTADYGTAARLLYKQAAIVNYAPTTGTIRSSLISGQTTDTEDYLPNGAGDATAVTSVTGATTHYEAVDDPVGVPDDATTYVSTTSATELIDYYELEDWALPNHVISSIAVYYRAADAGGDGTARPVLRLDGTNTLGTPQALVVGWTTYNETLSRPGGGNWQASDLDILQVGIGLWGDGAASARCTQIYITITYVDAYTETLSVETDSVTSGDYTVVVEANTQHLGMGIDCEQATLIPADGLIFHAPFWHTECDGSPFNSKDDSTTAVTNSGTTWSADTGRYFDGGDALDLGTDAAFDFERTDTFSFAFWFHPDDTGVTRELITRLGGPPDYSGYIIRRNNTNTLVVRLRHDETHEIYKSFEIIDNNPQFVGISYDGSSTAAGLKAYCWSLGGGNAIWRGCLGPTYPPWDSDKLYSLVNEDTLNDTMATGARTLYVGQGLGGNFAGYMGELSIYDRVLTGDEFEQYFEATAWKYGGGNTYTYYDSTWYGGLPEGNTGEDILTYTVPDDEYYYQAFYGASVTNNANNWILGSNVTPYLNYYEHSVGGSLITWYQPNDILDGTTLPDRQDGDGTQNGTITWGNNVETDVSFGAMESYASTSSSATGDGGFSMSSSPMPATWFAMGENVENLPFYDMIYNSVSAMDFPDVTEGVQTIYFVIIIGIAFACFLLLVMTTRSALLAFLAMIIVLFVGSSMTIIPMWIPFAILLTGIGIMYLYRQVAY